MDAGKVKDVDAFMEHFDALCVLSTGKRLTEIFEAVPGSHTSQEVKKAAASVSTVLVEQFATSLRGMEQMLQDPSKLEELKTAVTQKKGTCSHI